jgi:hypothetical protein
MMFLEAHPVDLCILDVTLALGDSYPDGCTLGQAILRRWPGIRLLFLSGYDRADMVAPCPPDLPLLQKPMHSQMFLARVAEVLMADPYRWPEEG